LLEKVVEKTFGEENKKVIFEKYNLKDINKNDDVQVTKGD